MVGTDSAMIGSDDDDAVVIDAGFLDSRYDFSYICIMDLEVLIIFRRLKSAAYTNGTV